MCLLIIHRRVGFKWQKTLLYPYKPLEQGRGGGKLKYLYLVRREIGRKVKLNKFVRLIWWKWIWRKENWRKVHVKNEFFFHLWRKSGRLFPFPSFPFFSNKHTVKFWFFCSCTWLFCVLIPQRMRFVNSWFKSSKLDFPKKDKASSFTNA